MIPESILENNESSFLSQRFLLVNYSTHLLYVWKGTVNALLSCGSELTFETHIGRTLRANKNKRWIGFATFLLLLNLVLENYLCSCIETSYLKRKISGRQLLQSLQNWTVGLKERYGFNHCAHVSWPWTIFTGSRQKSYFNKALNSRKKDWTPRCGTIRSILFS